MAKKASQPALFLLTLAVTLLISLAISSCIASPNSQSTNITTGTTETSATATPTPSPTPQPTIKPSPTVSPTPTTPPAPTIMPTPTEAPELVGIPPERLQFTTDLLNLFDNSVKDSNPAFNKIDDFVSREQIINYGKNGEGLSVIKHKDGTPAVALINCKDNVVASFKTAIKEMSAYDPNYLEVLTSNGMRAFMVNRYGGGSSGFTFNKSGLIIWNATEEKLSASNLSFALKKPVGTEALGIKMLQLGGDYSNYVGFMKQILSSDCWWNLYKKNGQEYCEIMSYSGYTFAKLYYNEFYAPETFKDTKIQNLLKNVRDKNLATPFGGTWPEISASIVDRPDWQGGEIQ